MKMITVIPKGTSESEVEKILKQKGKKKGINNKLDAFFGSLPTIEDGLTFQKKARSEWK